MREFGVLLLLAACSTEPAARAVSSHGEAVVYGSDDRVEVFEHPDPRLRSAAQDSVVALVPKSSIVRSEAGPSLVAEPSEAYGLCADERFAEQPIVAICSGALIAQDLVVTAAHCVAEVACDEVSLAFDFYYAADGELAALHEESLYACQRIVVQGHQTSGTPRLDYAVLQLDRKVSGERTPLAIAQRRLEEAEPITTISFPIGMPTKIDSHAQVVDPRTDHGDYFRLISDVFEGSSGGAVLNADAELVGILANGGIDFTATDAGCATAAVVPDDENPITLERASYPGPILDALCDSGWKGPPCAAATRADSGGCSVVLEPRTPGPYLTLFVGLLVTFWLRRHCRGRGRARCVTAWRQDSAHFPCETKNHGVRVTTLGDGCAGKASDAEGVDRSSRSGSDRDGRGGLWRVQFGRRGALALGLSARTSPRLPGGRRVSLPTGGHSGHRQRRCRRRFGRGRTTAHERHRGQHRR